MKTLLTGSYEEVLGPEEEEDIGNEPDDEDEWEEAMSPLFSQYVSKFEAEYDKAQCFFIKLNLKRMKQFLFCLHLVKNL